MFLVGSMVLKNKKLSAWEQIFAASFAAVLWVLDNGDMLPTYTQDLDVYILKSGALRVWDQAGHLFSKIIPNKGSRGIMLNNTTIRA